MTSVLILELKNKDKLPKGSNVDISLALVNNGKGPMQLAVWPVSLNGTSKKDLVVLTDLLCLGYFLNCPQKIKNYL